MAKPTKAQVLADLQAALKEAAPDLDPAVIAQYASLVKEHKVTLRELQEQVATIKAEPDALRRYVLTMTEAASDDPLTAFRAAKKKIAEKAKSPAPKTPAPVLEAATPEQVQQTMADMFGGVTPETPAPTPAPPPEAPKPTPRRKPTFAELVAARGGSMGPIDAMAGTGPAPSEPTPPPVEVPGLGPTRPAVHAFGREAKMVAPPPKPSTRETIGQAMGGGKPGTPIADDLNVKDKGAARKRLGKWALALGIVGSVAGRMVRPGRVVSAQEQLMEYQRVQLQDQAIEQFKERQPTLYQAAMNLLSGAPIAPPMTESEVLIGSSKRASMDDVPQATQRAVIGALAGIQ